MIKSSFFAYQQTICDVLNTGDALVQAGCKAFVEDALDVETEVTRHLQEAGGIAILIATPEVEYAGAYEDGSLCMDIRRLEAVCTEYPALNRQREGAMTALDAALQVAFLLRTRERPLLRIVQTADAEAGLLTATATFSDCVRISPDGNDQ